MDYWILVLQSVKYGLDFYDSHKASMNHVIKEKDDSIPVTLRELLQEISIMEKTLLQRINCSTLKYTQLKEVCNKYQKKSSSFPSLPSLNFMNEQMLVLVFQCENHHLRLRG